MSADFNPFAANVFRIDPLLDFTADTAFVAVKILVVSGQTVCDQVAVVASNRELIRWNGADTPEDNPFGEGIIAGCG